MKTFYLSRLVSLCLISAVSFLSLPAIVTAGSAEVKAELLVKLRRDPPVQDRAAVHASVGATVLRSFEAIGWQLVRLPDGMSVGEGLAKYRAHPAVAAVELNNVIWFTPPPPVPAEPIETAPSEAEAKLRSASANQVIPNDPRWSAQWNLRQIGMPAAWNVTTGSSNVVVAVMDTGVDYTHEDLRDNMWRNPGESGLDDAGNDKATNGIDDDGNGYADDVYGIDTVDDDGDPMDPGFVSPTRSAPFYHGTACAGIIAAAGNNRTGISGISWSSRIMALRLYQFEETTVTWRAFEANVVEAFEYTHQDLASGGADRTPLDLRRDVSRRTDPPLLVVEIFSPQQGAQEVLDINSRAGEKIRILHNLRPTAIEP